MKTIAAIALSFMLSIMILGISASQIESGDINAIGMYFVVFLIPIMIISLLNGLILEIANRVKPILLKRIISTIPVIICIIGFVLGEIRIPQFDGNLAFISAIEAVSLGLTNLLWNFKLHPKKLIK